MKTHILSESLLKPSDLKQQPNTEIGKILTPFVQCLRSRVAGFKPRQIYDLVSRTPQ